MTNNELIIEPLINKINELEKNGFKNNGNMRIEGGTRLQDWTRDSGWKKERIQLHYSASRPTWCEITFWIYIVIDNHPYLLAAEDIGRLINSKRQYKLPALFKRVRSKATIEKMANDIFSSIYWFEEKDKRECLKLINSNDENIIISASKKIYPKAVALLSES